MKPFGYQYDGAEHLVHPPYGGQAAYLADGCGLGKTIEACYALQELTDVENVLVVTTASSVGNWQSERPIWAPRVNMEVISFDKARAARDLDGADWDAVLVDEAHNAKNHKAKRTKAALKLAAEAPRAMLLSATPMPNHPGELWAPFHYLWPELLTDDNRTHDQWLRRYCRYTMHPQYGPRVYGVQNTAELRALLAQVMLRRRLEDVALELPPLRITQHMLPPDPEFERHLAAAGVDVARLVESMEREEVKESPSLSRLRHMIGIYKAPRIASVIAAELEDKEYRKIVVFYQHTDVGDILLEALRQFGVVRIDGNAPAQSRQAFVKAFNRPERRVFLAQQQAAGEALNLQAASEMVLVEPPWTPTKVEQLVGRIRRIGQASPCRARVFGVLGSSDAGVMKTLVRKASFKREVDL